MTMTERTLTLAEAESKRRHGYLHKRADGVLCALFGDSGYGTTLEPVEINEAPEIVGADAHVTPDDRDAALLAERVTAYDEITGPRVGDWVRFADGIERRISHVWDFGDDPEFPPSAQTSDGGSFFLGHGYISFSGGLHPGVALSTLTVTGERRPGSVWFFHHDRYTASNGVHALAAFQVYECSEPATR